MNTKMEYLAQTTQIAHEIFNTYFELFIFLFL